MVVIAAARRLCVAKRSTPVAVSSMPSTPSLVRRATMVAVSSSPLSMTATKRKRFTDMDPLHSLRCRCQWRRSSSSSSSQDNSKSNRSSNDSVRAAKPLLDESNVTAEEEQLEPAASASFEQPPSTSSSTSPTQQQQSVGLGSIIRGAVERLKDEKFHAGSMSYSWSPDDLVQDDVEIIQTPKIDTPPVTNVTNRAQMYEIGGFEAMMTIHSSSSSSSSTTTTSSSSLDENSSILEETTSHPSNNSNNNNNNDMVGFHVRDGPVPRGTRVDNDVDGDGRNRRSRFMLHKQQQQQQQQQHHHRHHLQSSPPVTATTTAAREKYGSLMDPHVPIMPGQTHLIQGGTPCDLSPNDSIHRRPYTLADYGEESVYTLILLRHGESEWNASNRYTGWCDVNLTRRGEREARAAGRLLAANGIEIDHAFTSVLRRASYTTNMALNMAGQHWVPVTKTWRLNERHYGALQGYNKDTAYEELNIDQELVMEMRRSYSTPPPRMDDDHPHWHGTDRRYSKLSPDQLEASRAESLKSAAQRIMPFFNSVIVPSLKDGNRCLVVSHANTLRTLIKQIDNISDQDIKQLSIPTGIPLIYRLDKDMKPVDPNCELEFRYLVQPKGYTWATSRDHGFHGVYLGDLERLQDIQRKRDATNRGWQRVILRNIAKQSNDEDICSRTNYYHNPQFHQTNVIETKHLWWKITQKMQNPEFANMLLLVRMKEFLEGLLAYRRGRNCKNHRYIPLEAYERILEKIHLDSAGLVVDPFVSLEDRLDRECRQRRWIETLNSEKNTTTNNDTMMSILDSWQDIDKEVSLID